MYIYQGYKKSAKIIKNTSHKLLLILSLFGVRMQNSLLHSDVIKNINFKNIFFNLKKKVFPSNTFYSENHTVKIFC